MLVICLLIVLLVVIALPYYENTEYFTSSDAINPIARIGKPNGKNGSYGTLNAPGAQLGGSSIPINPVISINQSIPDAPNVDPWSQPPSDVTQVIQEDPQPWSQPPSVDATLSKQDIKPQVTVSDIGYTALERQNKSNLLKNIQQIVHNEIRASRNKSENHPIAMANESCDSSDSNAMQQGNEYKYNKPDMSKYIRKDSIPCWGCSLDY